MPANFDECDEGCTGTMGRFVTAVAQPSKCEPPAELPATRIPLGMVGPTAALVAVGLALTVFAGPLYAYTGRAATALQERTPYIDAVLPDGLRGEGVSADLAQVHP